MNTQAQDYRSNNLIRKKQSPRTPKISYRGEPTPTFIYVGAGKFSYPLTTAYHKKAASNLVDALRYVKSFEHSKLSSFVNAIVIDIEATVEELEKFSLLVREHTPCLILCNGVKLNENDIRFIRAFEIVDEVIDLDADFDLILQHAWMRKAQKQQKTFKSAKREIGKIGKQKLKAAGFFFKRVFDMTLAALIIIGLLPLLLLIAIAIKIDSEGPIMYSSLRAGKGYKIFKFYKFRSMVTDADKKINTLAHLNQYSVNASGPQFFKLNNDPRVTRVGKFLRNTSLDELPQLLNVLLGDMSLVGNRPLPLYEAATLTTNDYVERFLAPAGITGYWQIKKRGKAEMSVKERMDLDIHYARKASPLFDLYIILSTPAALLQKSDV